MNTEKKSTDSMMKFELTGAVIFITIITGIILFLFTGFLGKPLYVFIGNSFYPDKVTEVKLNLNGKNFLYDRYILQYCPNVEKIDSYNYDRTITLENIDFLKKQSRLKELDIECICKDWSALKNLHSLEKIIIYCTNFDDISLLRSSTSLKTICISNSPLVNDFPKLNSNELASDLNSFNNLERFQMCGYSIDENILKELCQIKDTTELHIMYCRYDGNINDAMRLAEPFTHMGYEVDIDNETGMIDILKKKSEGENK